MKVALVELYKAAKAEQLDFKLVGNIHDEIQAEVLEEHSIRFGELVVQSVRRAGEILNLRCPLDAEYKIGNSWAETH